MSTAATPSQSAPAFIAVPGWSRYPWLRAGFSVRQGGSSVVYGPGEQNLGWTAEDTPQMVARNRQRFVGAVSGGVPMQLTTLHQIHGAVVRDLGAEPTPWMTPEGKARMQGDGILTRDAGQLVGVITADCAPVLLADKRTRAVAALHAGWRGTLARIVEQGIAALGQRCGARPEDLVAAIGPSICSCCFEVGEEIRKQFRAEFAYGDALFQEPAPGARPRMDLQRANREQLLAAGVAPENICVIAECTACTRLPDGRRRYFSHRAERGVTGRMLNVVGTVPI